MKGHENKKKYPIPITDHGHGEKMVRDSREKKMHAMRGSKDNLKVIKKMCTFEVHLCMMFGQLILSGKPFNTFSMTKLKTLQFRLTLAPLFTATHAFLFSNCEIMEMINMLPVYMKMMQSCSSMFDTSSQSFQTG
jgi:hypothetical protein